MPYLARKGRAFPKGTVTTEIERLLDTGTLAETLFILPTGAWARQLQRHAIECAGPRTLVQPHIYSLQEFIARLAATIRPHKRLISDSEVAVLIELAIRDLFKSNTLSYYEERSSGSSYPLPHGTFELIVAAISGLKQKGVRPQDLADLLKRKHEETEGAAERSEFRKLRDLYAIYADYNERLGTTLTDTYGQYFDLLDMLAQAGGERNERIRSICSETYAGISQIVVSGFTFIDEPARQILNAIDASGAIPVVYEVEHVGENPVLFKLHSDLVDLQSKEGFRYAYDDAPRPRGLSQTLFNDDVASGARLDLKNRISVGSAVNVHDEVRLAARTVKQLIASKPKGYELSRIAVVMYRQGGYSRVVQQTFREYGIPTSLTERLPLASSPLFVAVDSLLKLAERGLSPHLILRLLSTPYLEFISGERDIDRSALFAVINEHRLPPGRWSWQDELAIILDSIEAQLERQDNEMDERRLRASYERARKARVDMQVIELLVKSLHDLHTPSAFVSILRKTFYEHGLVRRLLSSDREMLRADALEEDTRSYGALSQLLTEFLVLSKALGIEHTKLPISYYGERLRAAALRMRYAPHLEPGKGIMVTSIEQAIGMDVDHIIALGMNDDVFPELYAQSALVPREHHKEEHVHLAEQRYLFYQLLSTPKQTIHITYERGTAADAKLPSPFVHELKQVAEVSQTVDAPQILTTREFLEYYSRGDEDERKKALAIASKQLRGEIDTHIGRAVIHHRTQDDRKGVLPSEMLTEREREFLESFRTRQYSVSQLETYATCPFKYFEKYVLGLGETDVQQLEEGFSAADKGLMLHEKFRRILEHVYAQRAEDPTVDHRTLSPQALRASDPSPDHDSEKFGGIRKQHPFWRLDLEATFDAPYTRDIFENFLDEENKLARLEIGKGLIPFAFEKAFAEMPLSHPERDDLPPLRLRGKIDRIDFNDEAGAVVVIDYKSRNAPKIADIEEGLKLQLPLYLRIAENLVEGRSDVKGVAAYYHTLVGEKASRSPAIAAKDFLVSLTPEKPKGPSFNRMPEDYDGLRMAIDKSVRHAFDYVEGMTQGRFPLIREDRADKADCFYCPYKKSCRVNEAAEMGILPKPSNG